MLLPSGMVIPSGPGILLAVIIALLATGCLVLGYHAWLEPSQQYGTPSVTLTTLDSTTGP